MQEDPENYNIFEVGFKTSIKAARHHATTFTETVSGSQLNTELSGFQAKFMIGSRKLPLQTIARKIVQCSAVIKHNGVR